MKIYCCCFLFLFIFSNGLLAAQKEKQLIKLAVGESEIVTVKYKVEKVAVGAPEIADVKLISQEEVLVNGKSLGITTLLIFDDKGKKEKYLIQVIRSLLPIPMIQLSVQVVEVKVKALKQLGINWVDTLTFGEENIPAVFELGTIARFTKLTAVLNLLIEQGDANILAKPNLVAMNNGKASFLVGGEIPYLKPSGGFGPPTVGWKEYGVMLEISPRGDLKTNIIATDIRAEVSNLDYVNAIKLGGYSIPALNVREASTEIQLDAGSTIVIAGLKQTGETKQQYKLPILGYIPVLGYLFKKQISVKEETEVTIFVTPTFVKTIK